jgi:hypothetical protein
LLSLPALAMLPSSVQIAAALGVTAPENVEIHFGWRGQATLF